MGSCLLLSRRQGVALLLLLGIGVAVGLGRAGAAAPSGAEPAAWTARVAFLEANRAALIAAPGLSPSDVRARFRQTASDPIAPWAVYLRRVNWSAAEAAVIARYVDLPNVAPAAEVDKPIDRRRRRTRHFRLWP